MVLHIARPVTRNLVGQRCVASVGLDLRQPRVHGIQPTVDILEIPEQRDRATPHHMVAGAAVLALDAPADPPRMQRIVRNPRIGSDEGQNRHRIQVVGHIDHAAAIRIPHGRVIGPGAGGLRLDIDIQTTDLDVQVNKHRRCDEPGAQGVEAVLHPGVTQRNAGEPKADLLLDFRPDFGTALPENMRHPFQNPATLPGWVGLGIVAGIPRAVAGGLGRRLEQTLIGDHGVHMRQMPFHRPPQQRVPDHPWRPATGVFEVLAHQMQVGKLQPGRQRVRIRTHGQQALIQTRVGVGDGQLGNRAPRTTRANGIAQRAVLLHKALLGHHDRFGRQGHIAVVPGIGQRRRQHRIALPQGIDVAGLDERDIAESARVVIQRCITRRVLGPAVATMGDQHLAVPLRLRCPGLPRRLRVEQRQDLVLVAILVTQLLAHDEGHGLAILCGGHGHIIWRIVGIVGQQVGAQRHPGDRLQHIDQGRGAVEVAVLGRLVTGQVHRPVLTANPLDLGPGEYRPLIGIVGDGRTGLSTVKLDDESILTNSQPIDAPHDAAVIPACEVGADVLPVQGNPQAINGLVTRNGDLDQRIATTDHVGAVGQHQHRQTLAPRLDRLGHRRRTATAGRHQQPHGHQSATQGGRGNPQHAQSPRCTRPLGRSSFVASGSWPDAFSA